MRTVVNFATAVEAVNVVFKSLIVMYEKNLFSSLLLMGLSGAVLGATHQLTPESGFTTGFCLDSNPQGQVYTLACNGGNYQNWQ